LDYYFDVIRFPVGGAQPYFPCKVSTSVPQTPAAITSTNAEPSFVPGSGISTSLAVHVFLGSTVIAFMAVVDSTDRLEQLDLIQSIVVGVT
jgi:hypothetical protein